MIVLKTVAELNSWRQSQDLEIGFVPTMGALHAGHTSLLERARRENRVVITSVFVNPTQFNDPKDFASYPNNLKKDLEILSAQKVDAAFVPTPENMYPDNFRYEVRETKDADLLCGAHRPGHFTGMLTVVLKLFNLVRPQRAYFGQKDFQQLKLVEGMVDSLFLPITIVPCPTVREADGLAMSSRNQRLTVDQRERAPFLYRTLKEAKDCASTVERLTAAGFLVEYVEEKWGRRLAAAQLGSVRLIDNVEI